MIDGNEDAKIYMQNYTASSPIAVNASTKVISHSTSGVTANTYGTTSSTELTPAFGGSFSVPGFTVNGTGHMTVAGAHNVKIPSLTNTPAYNNGVLIDTLNINGVESKIYIPSNPEFIVGT